MPFKPLKVTKLPQKSLSDNFLPATVILLASLIFFNIISPFCYTNQQKESFDMKPLKNKVSITLDADIIDKIKELAEEDDRSFSQYINLVLREHIKTLDKIE